MQERGISTVGCLEKSDLVVRQLASAALFASLVGSRCSGWQLRSHQVVMKQSSFHVVASATGAQMTDSGWELALACGCVCRES